MTAKFRWRCSVKVAARAVMLDDKVKLYVPVAGLEADAGVGQASSKVN
jgi:hypothetical protein